MRASTTPVTPSVLQWAVGEDGRGIAELAGLLRVDTSELEAWARGDGEPTRGQVTRLAEVLKRPRALFFLPAPPEGASTPPAFRHPPGATRAATPGSLKAFRRARRVQQAVAWSRGEGFEVALPTATLGDSPERAAAAVRSWLGISLEEQGSWADDRAALHAWREVLDERDILVFSLEIGQDEVRGFSAWDPVAPMLAVNVSSVTPAARIFTLGHELAHLVLRSDSACVELSATVLREAAGRDPAARERWCEEFAAALLMPGAAVREFGRGTRFVDPAGLDEVKRVMVRFRVSGRAAALRLIQLGMADRALYAKVVAALVPKKPARRSDDFKRPARSTSRLREYGSRTLGTVLSTLPETDAMSVLRIDWTDVRRLADEKVPGVRAS